MLHAGDLVEYQSESRGPLKCKVLAGPHSDGTYDLDCKPRVPRAKITLLGIPEPQAPISFGTPKDSWPQAKPSGAGGSPDPWSTQSPGYGMHGQQGSGHSMPGGPYSAAPPADPWPQGRHQGTGHGATGAPYGQTGPGAFGVPSTQPRQGQNAMESQTTAPYGQTGLGHPRSGLGPDPMQSQAMPGRPHSGHGAPHPSYEATSGQRPLAHGAPPGTVCFYKSATRGWIPALVQRFHPEDGTYDLDCKEQAKSENIVWVEEGSMVEYHSPSQDKWIPARVLRKGKAPGHYDLDVKEGAEIQRMRPHVASEPGTMACMPGMLSYPAGPNSPGHMDGYAPQPTLQLTSNRSAAEPSSKPPAASDSEAEAKAKAWIADGVQRGDPEEIQAAIKYANSVGLVAGPEISNAIKALHGLGRRLSRTPSQSSLVEPPPAWLAPSPAGGTGFLRDPEAQQMQQQQQHHRDGMVDLQADPFALQGAKGPDPGMLTQMLGPKPSEEAGLMTRVLGPKPGKKDNEGILDRIGAREEGGFLDRVFGGKSQGAESAQQNGTQPPVAFQKNPGIATAILGPKPTEEAGMLTRVLGPNHMFKPADPSMDIHGRPLAGAHMDASANRYPSDSMPTDVTNRAAASAGLPYHTQAPGQAPPTNPQLQPMPQQTYGAGAYEAPPTDPRLPNMQAPNASLAGSPPYGMQTQMPPGYGAPPTDPQLQRVGNAPQTDPQLQPWGAQGPGPNAMATAVPHGGYGGYRPS